MHTLELFGLGVSHYHINMPLIARRFSITNFLIASSALGFQVFVLYPWHNKLDDDFTALKKENVRLLQTIEQRLAQVKEKPAVP